MYTLIDAKEMNREHPTTFFIPEQAEIEGIKEGSLVKLAFQDEWFSAERMWVTVTKVDRDKFTGVLDNEPYDIPNLSLGDEVTFEARHIYEVWED